MSEEEDADIVSSLLHFAEEQLGFTKDKLGELYDWQVDSISPFDELSEELVQVSLATPNGSGKSARVIPVIVLGCLYLYRRSKVVLTTADGKQLDGQVMPALEQYRGKFPHWKFIEREIQTPGIDGTFNTGSRFVSFTTDDPGRAEGWHKADDKEGPLIMIVDEAKTVPDAIFQALDRCTYNALLLTSSPGPMRGRFYESQMARKDFIKIRVGLKDCPHITKEKIDRLQAQYGPNGTTPNPAFLASTLEGQFMEADAELRFNPEGLKRLTEMARVYEVDWRSKVKTRADLSPVGTLNDNARGIQWLPQPDVGWIWVSEHPIPGCDYIGFADPMTGEQSEGSKTRDTHAFGIMRVAYTRDGEVYDDEIVAILHAESGVRWDNDIAAERFDILLRYYGDCMAIVEANNAGTEVMRLLSMAGRTLWQREKRDDVTPGRKLKVVGFQTNTATKSHWIGALAAAIREQRLVCRNCQVVSHFGNFLLTEDGSGAAAPSCFDDFVTGVGLALFARDSATRMPFPTVRRMNQGSQGGAWS